MKDRGPLAQRRYEARWKFALTVLLILGVILLIVTDHSTGSNDETRDACHELQLDGVWTGPC